MNNQRTEKITFIIFTVTVWTKYFILSQKSYSYFNFKMSLL